MPPKKKLILIVLFSLKKLLLGLRKVTTISKICYNTVDFIRKITYFKNGKEK